MLSIPTPVRRFICNAALSSVPSTSRCSRFSFSVDLASNAHEHEPIQYKSQTFNRDSFTNITPRILNLLDRNLLAMKVGASLESMNVIAICAINSI